MKRIFEEHVNTETTPRRVLVGTAIAVVLMSLIVLAAMIVAAGLSVG